MYYARTVNEARMTLIRQARFLWRSRFDETSPSEELFTPVNTGSWLLILFWKRLIFDEMMSLEFQVRSPIYLISLCLRSSGVVGTANEILRLPGSASGQHSGQEPTQRGLQRHLQHLCDLVRIWDFAQLERFGTDYSRFSYAKITKIVQIISRNCLDLQKMWDVGNRWFIQPPGFRGGRAFIKIQRLCHTKYTFQLKRDCGTKADRSVNIKILMQR